MNITLATADNETPVQSGFVQIAPKTDCPHIAEPGAHLIDASSVTEFAKLGLNSAFFESSPKCQQCQSGQEPWICLACGTLGCSRYVNGHCAKHVLENPNHCLSVSLEDLGTWCHKCESYVTFSVNRPATHNFAAILDAFHLIKFGGHNPEVVAADFTFSPDTFAAAKQINMTNDLNSLADELASDALESSAGNPPTSTSETTTISSSAGAQAGAKPLSAKKIKPILDDVWVPSVRKRYAPKPNVVTAIFFNSFMFQHNMGLQHPEQPARLEAITKSIEKHFKVSMTKLADDPSKWSELAQKKKSTGGIIGLESQLIDENLLLLTHNAEHISHLKKGAPTNKSSGVFRIDADTAMNFGTWKSALLSAGALINAVDLVCPEDVPVTNAFCVGRPPGHHAEPGAKSTTNCGAMGFCFFSNVAIAAKYAIQTYPHIKKVAIFDYDVHHGNDQYPHYPGTGGESILPNIINIPMKAHTRSPEYRQLVLSKVLPAIESFNPDLILLSTGFDAHSKDMLADIWLVDDDYYWTSSVMCTYAAKNCNSRVISALEGGYSLEALYSAGRMHVWALTQAALTSDPNIKPTTTN